MSPLSLLMLLHCPPVAEPGALLPAGDPSQGRQGVAGQAGALVLLALWCGLKKLEKVKSAYQRQYRLKSWTLGCHYPTSHL